MSQFPSKLRRAASNEKCAGVHRLPQSYPPPVGTRALSVTLYREAR